GARSARRSREEGSPWVACVSGTERVSPSGSAIRGSGVSRLRGPGPGRARWGPGGAAAARPPRASAGSLLGRGRKRDGRERAVENAHRVALLQIVEPGRELPLDGRLPELLDPHREPVRRRRATLHEADAGNAP